MITLRLDKDSLILFAKYKWGDLSTVEDKILCAIVYIHVLLPGN